MSSHIHSALAPPAVGVSVLIPAKNEADNLPGLVADIEAALAGETFEIIVINDGSTDETENVIGRMCSKRNTLRMISHSHSSGQSSAIRSGLWNANGEIIVTIDGDGQNPPKHIPGLIDALRNGGSGVGLAAGERVGRKAGPGKKFASRVANRVRGSMLGDNARDSGCGLKAIRRELFVKLPFFNAWHRFMPALVTREGYSIVHVPVEDLPREHGTSKYGILDRALVGLIDLFGVWWLMRRKGARPDISEYQRT